MSFPAETADFANYLQRATVNEKEFLRNILQHVQERAPVTGSPTVEEIEAKLPYIRQISSMYTAPSNLDANGNLKLFVYWHLSSLWLISLTDLQIMALDINAINQYLDNFVPFVKQCFRGSLDIQVEARDKVPRGNLRPYVLQRDRGRCILTGRDAAVDAAHIWPFACLNSSKAATAMNNRWHVGMRMFGAHRAVMMNQLMSSAGDTEHIWNYITLSNDMHKCFDNGSLGLETLHDAIPNSTIRVRVQWFMTPLGCYGQRQFNRPVVPDSEAIQSMYAPLSHQSNTGYLDINLYNGIVESGNVYRINCETMGNRDRMFKVLDSRWQLACVFFCAGAAGYNAEDLDKPPGPEDTNFDELGREIPPAAYYDLYRDLC